MASSPIIPPIRCPFFPGEIFSLSGPVCRNMIRKEKEVEPKNVIYIWGRAAIKKMAQLIFLVERHLRMGPTSDWKSICLALSRWRESCGWAGLCRASSVLKELLLRLGGGGLCKRAKIVISVGCLLSRVRYEFTETYLQSWFSLCCNLNCWKLLAMSIILFSKILLSLVLDGWS